MSTWTVYLRNPDREREGQIDDYLKLECEPRYNDVGPWRLEIDRRARHAAALATPGYGIEVVRDGTAVFSGPSIMPERERTADRSMLTVVGRDDNVWLARRLAHPEPASSAPPYNTDEHDVETGTASTVLRQYVDVNAGPNALTQRQVPGLTLASDPVVGSTITGRARWQNLLELLQSLALAGGGLGFRVTQSGTDLEFEVYQPTDKTSSVVFSDEFQNVHDYRYVTEASSANYIYCGGGGEGTSRTIREGQDPGDIVSWGRIETFQDRRDTTDTSELDQEISEQLDEATGRTDLEFTPIDTDALTYLVDYSLGDKATVVIDGVEIQELIRSVKISLSPDDGERVIPAVTTPGRATTNRLFARQRELESRVRDLERR